MIDGTTARTGCQSISCCKEISNKGNVTLERWSILDAWREAFEVDSWGLFAVRKRNGELSQRFMWLRSRAQQRVELTHRRSMTGPWSMVDITVKLVQLCDEKMNWKTGRARHRGADTSAITVESVLQKASCLTPPTCHNCAFR